MIESAIKGLISGSQIKPEWMETLVDTLQADLLAKRDWQNLFDGLGATTAIEKRSYHQQMVRLITLRAIVLPETLPEYLLWLNSDKKTERTTSVEFQAGL